MELTSVGNTGCNIGGLSCGSSQFTSEKVERPLEGCRGAVEVIG